MMVIALNRTPMPMKEFDEVKVSVNRVPPAARDKIKRDPSSKTMLRMRYNGSDSQPRPVC